jgi:hypothetical protein
MKRKPNQQNGNEVGVEAQLDDLQITDDKSGAIKGGPGVTVLAWARVDGISTLP